MSRKGQTITLSISEQDKAKLEALALEFGFMWGDRPNISKLIEAVSRRQLQVAPNHDWSSLRLEALKLAIKALAESGKLDEAREIAWLLSERSELSSPSRGEIEHFLDNPLPLWRKEINRSIARQQPFRLAYRDAADHLWSYIILYGQSVQVNNQQYLLCRCQEEGQEVEGLRHNWRLRLDRITEASVATIDKPWAEDLERISVEFQLRGGLAFSYQRQNEDSFFGNVEGDPPARRVVRNISSTVWFLQEISGYWEECMIISPDSVRSRHIEKLKAMGQNYQLKIAQELRSV